MQSILLDTTQQHEGYFGNLHRSEYKTGLAC
jgi:hypothetical protein